MKIFLAGKPRYPKHHNRFDYYRLDSFHYMKNAADVPRYKDFILDSGVFTFLNQKKAAIDWYAYADKYAAFIVANNIENYVEIDVDCYLGLEAVEKLRAYLEKRVGWKSMPVWHLNRGWDKWTEICKSHEYICFGAFITDGLKPSQYKILPQFLSEAKKHGTRVHGLGFTDMKGLVKYKFDSVDSSTWTMGCRVGMVFVIRDNLIKQIDILTSYLQRLQTEILKTRFQQPDTFCL